MAVAGSIGEGDTARSSGSVFLSYSRGDLAAARPVIDLLAGTGLDVWWDGRLEGGENFLKTTEAALEGADCVVVLWSATSVDSHWVRDEAQRGRERGCLVPLSLDGTMAPLGFRQFQLLDISGWNGDPAADEAKRILVAVQSRLGGAETGRSPLPPSPSPPLPTPLSPVTAPIRPARFILTRRNALLGGAGLAGSAALLGAWQAGWLPRWLGRNGSGTTSMVVLPFANLTGDAARKYFSDGLARELRSVLARNPRLKVAAPTSSTALEGEDDFAIGRKLGVAHILRGSVQRDPTRLRISAELVRIDGGLVRWAETYDRALEDVFAVQTEIAETVALSLVAEVASEDEARRSVAVQEEVGGTQSVAAYEAFLRGVARYDLSSGEDSDRAALQQFDTAIAEDANYAAAHAMRSTMLAAIANAARDAAETQRLYAASITAAERAIAIEPQLARGHLALGFALSHGQLKLGEAAPHYRAAQQLAPGDADVLRGAALFQAYGAQHAQAAQMIARVLELDPLNARAFRMAGFIALFGRDYPLAVTRMERALALNPTIVSAPFGIALARLMQGDAVGALVAAEQEPVPVFALTASAIALHRQGNAAAADAALARLVAEFDGSLYQQAQVHAQRGELAKALDLLDRAWAATDPGLLWAPTDPLLDPLRSEPRFGQLLSRFGS